MPPTPESRIVEHLARDASERIVHRVRRQVMKVRGAMQSGGDSGLKDTWEEYCVQVQGQESAHFGLYEDLIEGLLGTACRKLKPLEREAIWLQTDAGVDWRLDEEREVDSPPVSFDDVQAYLIGQLRSMACNCTNQRIEKYLARSTPD